MSPAGRQLAALLWLFTTCLVAWAWQAGTPLDAAALRPYLQQAHSFAAEATMLARQAGERRLPAPVLERQAERLLDHVRQATRELADLRVDASLRSPRDAARIPLLAVERGLEQLAAGQPADRAALGQASAALQAQALAVDRAIR